MRCALCNEGQGKVTDSRPGADDGSSWRRRRKCGTCGGKFSTYEVAVAGEEGLRFGTRSGSRNFIAPKLVPSRLAYLVEIAETLAPRDIKMLRMMAARLAGDEVISDIDTAPLSRPD